MKRRKPSQARSKETVKTIMDALSRIIEADGYPSATTVKIAKEAGVGVATLYAYFEDKEDILSSVLETQANEALQLLSDGLPVWVREDRKTAVRSFIQFVVTEVSRRAAITKTLLIHAPHLADNPKSARVVGQFEMVLGLIIRLPDSTNSGDSSADSFIALYAILGLIRGLATGLPADVTPEDIVDRMEAIALRFLDIE